MTYHSGDDIRPGDVIAYAGSPGVVEFVITGVTGDVATDWYLEDNPRGGVMIFSDRWAHLFLPDLEKDEYLDLISRKP